MSRFSRVTLVIVLSLAAVFGVVAMSIVRHGVSARDKPTRAEEWIARSLRHLAVPATMRSSKNPVPLTPRVLAEGRAHFADHCAQCHGNDGRGKTEMGRKMYPNTPDMTRDDTQKLSDGEIFSIIKNGVRLTGMPAWGDERGSDDADTWKLVHFIRHLPRITPEEIDEMRALNPVSPSELEQRRQEAAFLSGAGEPEKPHAHENGKEHR